MTISANVKRVKPVSSKAQTPFLLCFASLFTAAGILHVAFCLTPRVTAIISVAASVM